MKMYSREEVIEKIKEFQGYLAQEKMLQQELMELRLYGDQETVSQNQQRHDELIAQIEEIRFTRILPILQEMSEFVKECQKIEKENYEREKASHEKESQE